MRPWVVLALAACGGANPPPQASGPPAASIATPAAGDLVVATVNGRPVYGSCVAAQAQHATREAALAECVGFELMAQAAERRGLATDPDVIDATRTALVNRLVEVVYEDGFTKPADFGPIWDQLRAKTIVRLRHGDYRGSTYVRVPLPKNADPAAEAAAHALADQIAAALANETGLMGPHVVEIADKVAAGREIQHADVVPYVESALEDNYAHALFSISEIGRASPAVRTKFGWDVIAWTSDVPPADMPDSEIALQLLPDVKRGYFPLWVEHIARASGIHHERIETNVPLLEDLP